MLVWSIPLDDVWVWSNDSLDFIRQREYTQLRVHGILRGATLRANGLTIQQFRETTRTVVEFLESELDTKFLPQRMGSFWNVFHFQ